MRAHFMVWSPRAMYRSIAPSAQSDVRHPSYEPEVGGCDKEGTGDSHLGGRGDALYDTKNLQMHNSCATVLQSCLFFALYPDIQVNYGIWGKNIHMARMDG